MRFDVVSPKDLTTRQVDAWRAFQRADPSLASPFLTPEWAQAVERAQGPGRVAVAAASRDGRPVAFFTARVGAFTAVAVGAPLSDYQAVLAEPGARVEAAAMLKALGVSRYDFTHVPADQTTFREGFRGTVLSRIVDVSAGWPAYEAAIKAAKSDLLRDIRQRVNRCQRELGPVRFTADNRDPADFAAMLGWKRKQYADTRQPDVLRPAWTRRLMDDLFRNPSAAMGGLFSTLHIGDRLAAGNYSLSASHVMHDWFLSFDDDFHKASPGMVLIGELTRHLAESGRWTEFDLGPGDYRFKLRLANSARELGYGYVGRPSPAVAVRSAAYRVRRWAEARPDAKWSTLPGKAMRRWDVMRALG